MNEQQKRAEEKKKEIYDTHLVRFRRIEDKELLEDMDKALKEGKTKREWFRELYYLAPEIPTDLCSIKEVENKLTTFKIPYRTRVLIINSLKKGI